MTWFSFQTGVSRRKPFGGGRLSITRTPSRRPIPGRKRKVVTRPRKDGTLRHSSWVVRHQRRPKRGRGSLPPAGSVTAARGRRKGLREASVELPPVDLPLLPKSSRITTTHHHGNTVDRALPELGGLISVTFLEFSFSLR